MSLNSLDVTQVGGYLAGAWKRQLNTGEDPANGRWYTNGANGDNIGLYGGLTDTLPTGLTFNDAALTYLPQSIVANSSIINNVDGLTPQATAQLSYTHTDSSTTSHTITHSLKVGAGLDVKGKIDFIIAGGEATVKMSIDYTFSYATTTSESTSDAQTFSISVPVTVPKGKIYKAVLIATVESIQVPYTADIIVTGTSETWFEDRINGHYNWAADAGTLFGWISQYAAAGDDSTLYRNLGDGRGALRVSGTMSAKQTAQFQAQIYDVTDAATADTVHATGRSLAAVPRGESPVPDGKLVQTVPVSNTGELGKPVIA